MVKEGYSDLETLEKLYLLHKSNQIMSVYLELYFVVFAN